MKLYLLTDSEDEYGYTLYIGIFKTIEGVIDFVKNYEFFKSYYGEIKSVDIVIKEGQTYGHISVNNTPEFFIDIIDTDELK